MFVYYKNGIPGKSFDVIMSNIKDCQTQDIPTGFTGDAPFVLDKMLDNRSVMKHRNRGLNCLYPNNIIYASLTDEVAEHILSKRFGITVEKEGKRNPRRMLMDYVYYDDQINRKVGCFRILPEDVCRKILQDLFSDAFILADTEEELRIIVDRINKQSEYDRQLSGFLLGDNYPKTRYISSAVELFDCIKSKFISSLETNNSKSLDSFFSGVNVRVTIGELLTVYNDLIRLLTGTRLIVLNEPWSVNDGEYAGQYLMYESLDSLPGYNELVSGDARQLLEKYLNNDKRIVRSGDILVYSARNNRHIVNLTPCPMFGA